MMQYLSILLRNQFNLFYRFGYAYIPKCQLLKFDGVIDESTKENLIKLFSETTPFEWEEEYLILHFDKSEELEGQVINFQIQDIVKVYPLSARAKSSIETKIDQRIRLEKPVFENILPKVEQTIEKHELEKAIQALWKICDIEDDLNKYISNIGLDNIFNGLERRKLGTKCFQIKDGNYWEYVLAYDRFDFFPNSILGYFYDAGQIFANTKGRSSFEGSELHKFLQSINNSNPGIRFKEIKILLETEEQANKYVVQTSVNEQLQYLITPLYLMLKDEIRKAEDIKSTNLFKQLKTLKEFGPSFNYAIILLGSFFGFKKFYDAYYDNLNLRFYKSYQSFKDKKEKVEKVIFDNQPELNKSILSNDDAISEDRSKIYEQPLEAEQKTSEEIPVSPDPTSTEDKTKSKEPKTASNDNQEISEGLKGKDNIESKIKDEILPTDDMENKVSEIQIEPQSNSDTETVIRLKNIINELLSVKTEMKLTDMGDKIKEVTGQKITNTIIKNVIKSMDNVEIVPKKKPETARKIIMQDLFNKQV
jgi:hypothetical protein